MKQQGCGLGWWWVCLAVPALFCACGRPAGAPPPGINYYLEMGKPHAPASATGTIHAPLDELLSRHVDNHGLVDYVGLATDVAQLDAYLVSMAQHIPAPAAASDLPAVSAEMAFWINVHNAAALRAVLQAGVPDTVTSVPDFFTRPVFAGLSLKAIKDDKLRARFRDPRVHMVLTYCARGGPMLERHAFTAADLDWRLSAATVRFCNNRAYAAIYSTSDEIRLSPILREYSGEKPGEPRYEYGEDFGTTHRQRRLWLARYIPPSYSRYLKNNVPQKVIYTNFDWRLNRQDAPQTNPIPIFMAPPGEP